MELRHLRYFIAVALEENVSKAALRLHVSQPALSRQVRDLEEEMGVALLERGAKSVRLTEAGRVFLEEASEVLERLEKGIAAARATVDDEKHELNVGYAPSLSTRILPPVLRAFRDSHPGIKVKLHDLSTEELLAELRSGDLDFALFVKPSNAKLRGLDFEGMQAERVLLAMSPHHDLSDADSVDLDRLRHESMVGFSREKYPDYCDMMGRIFGKSSLPKFVEELDSAASLIVSVEVGKHVAIVTDSLSCMAGSRLRLVPLNPEPKPLSIGFAWKKGGLAREGAAFLDAARGEKLNYD